MKIVLHQLLVYLYYVQADQLWLDLQKAPELQSIYKRQVKYLQAAYYA